MFVMVQAHEMGKQLRNTRAKRIVYLKNLNGILQLDLSFFFFLFIHFFSSKHFKFEFLQLVLCYT